MSKSELLKVVGEAESCNLKSAEGPKINSTLDSTMYSGNVAFVTLGCSKNTVDSEVMMGVLQRKGYAAVQDLAAADLIVVNTCAFLESAVKEGIDTILDVSKYKTEGRCRKLLVAGCMVERYREELSKSLPEVDGFVSTDQLLEIGEDTEVTDRAFSEARRPYFLYDDISPRVLSTPSYSAYVKIAEGCDRPCAFCIIPKIRGSFRSRSVDSVASEVSNLLRQGVREINFVAQDLTAYGSDFPGNRGIKSELPALIKSIDQMEVEDDFWLRLFYAYPVGVNEELIKLIEGSKRTCKYLDMPLQHISNSVLKAMRRPLGEKGTRALIEEIRNSGPNLKLRTTFVVGFPGETEEDVDILESYILEGHFTHVGIFTYSQEKEAASYVFANQVEEEVKDERRSRLMEAQQKVLETKLSAFVGKREKVIFEGVHPESEMLFMGRTDWQGPDADGMTIINEVGERFLKEERGEDGEMELVFSPELLNLEGKFVDVEITGVAGYDITATIL